MLIESPKDLEGLKNCGRVTRETLSVLRKAVMIGKTSKELESLAKDVFDRYGARSAPTIFKGFPGTVLISINDEAVHGIPSERTIQAGDIVKLDVTPELNGFVTDACITVAVPPVSKATKLLLKSSQKALQKAIEVAKAGVLVNTLGRMIEREVKRNGFTVIRELGGHGVGRRIHEPPEILNFYDPKQRTSLKEGMVITIEPIICSGSGQVYTAKDKWTIKTKDQSPVAHFEHTLLITKGKALVLTA